MEKSVEKVDPSQILAQICSVYMFSGQYLSPEEVCEKFSLTDIELRRLFLENEFDKKLAARGYPEYQFDKLPKKATADFDPLFVLACEKILDANSSKSFSARIKELSPLGITSTTWTNWMKEPKYFNYANTIFKARFDKDVDLQADMALARNVMAGDLPSIKFYKEITGKFRPQTESQIAVVTMMNIFFEIVSKYLSPEVIDSVAEELENSPIGELMQ